MSSQNGKPTNERWHPGAICYRFHNIPVCGCVWHNSSDISQKLFWLAVYLRKNAALCLRWISARIADSWFNWHHFCLCRYKVGRCFSNYSWMRHNFEMENQNIWIPMMNEKHYNRLCLICYIDVLLCWALNLNVCLKLILVETSVCCSVCGSVCQPVYWKWNDLFAGTSVKKQVQYFLVGPHLFHSKNLLNHHQVSLVMALVYSYN